MSSPDARSDRDAPSWRSWLTWHGMAAAVLALAPTQIYFGRPLWVMDPARKMIVLSLGVGYAVSAILVALGGRRQRPTIRSVLTIALAVFGLYFFFLLESPRDYSRGVVGLSLALALVLIAASPPLRRPRAAHSLVGVALILVLVGWGVVTQSRFADRSLRVSSEPALEQRVLSTLLYDVSSTTYHNYFGVEIEGGGIAMLGDAYLVVTASGQLYRARRADSGASLEVEELPLQLPQNREAYEQDLGQGRAAAPTFFRVTDALVIESASNVRLFVAHSFWRPDAACSVMRVSAIDWSSPDLAPSALPSEWRSVFEAAPCRRFHSENQGGRMAMLADGRLLLALGDQDLDGVKNPEVFAQDPEAQYGKILLIDVETGEAETYSSGHRNPQGLYVSPEGTVWSSEHGPRGGDEINRIVRGGNYGWPLATYGTAYFQQTWPLADVPGSHLGYDRPFYSWVGRTVGPSNLVGIEGSTFPLWQDDLVMASLRGQALWRVRIRNGAVAYVEEIPFADEIRDIIEDRDGRLVLWSDGGSLTFLEPTFLSEADGPSVALGRVLFAGCADCHSVDGRTEPGIGPDLRGIVGRRIGSQPGYRYSEALAGSGDTWSDDNLDSFLADPVRFAPGTTMDLPGFADPVRRASLLEYLKTLN